MQFYWSFVQYFYTLFHLKLFISKILDFSRVCLKMWICDFKWGHFTRNQQNFFVRLTECWWWFEDGKCDWQMVRVEPFCLSVFTLLSDCEQLCARLIDTNVPEQDIFLHWWLFPAILVSSGLFYPRFSFIERLFVSDFSPPPLHILTHRDLNWLVSVSLFLIEKKKQKTKLIFSLFRDDLFIDLPLCGLSHWDVSPDGTREKGSSTPKARVPLLGINDIAPFLPDHWHSLHPLNFYLCFTPVSSALHRMGH